MRVVIDANVVIAAAASRGICEAIFELCLEHHEIIVCKELLIEIEAKLTKKLKVPKSIVSNLIKVIKTNSSTIKPEHIDKKACRDPNDLMILGLVNPGQIDAIITGDKDLLVLKKYGRAVIVSPRQFWESSKR